MKRATLLLPGLMLVLLAGCPSVDDDDTAEEDPEILDPEPPGAPTAMVDGRITCVGDNEPPDPSAATLELTGWVRTWDDPEAEGLPPSFEVEAFSPSGSSLGAAFTNPNPGQDGRVAVTVPVTDDGFVGHVMITAEGYVPVRFHNSLPITNTDFGGWVWAITAEEVQDVADDLGVVLEADTGILVGAIHDCDSFGMSNGVVVVDDSAEGVYYF